MDLLPVLHKVEADLPFLLQDEGGWQTMDITYEPPHVERLWRTWGYDHRIYIHRIFPCAPEEALFHPHPWPSIVKILSEKGYFMRTGYGPGLIEPPSAVNLLLSQGSVYEMTNPDGWHAVIPLDGPSLSLMITGRPWGRPMPKKHGMPQGPLSDKTKRELLRLARLAYPNPDANLR